MFRTSEAQSRPIQRLQVQRFVYVVTQSDLLRVYSLAEAYNWVELLADFELGCLERRLSLTDRAYLTLDRSK